MNIPDVQPGLLRKYLIEYVILALVACVVYLFLNINSLNGYIRDRSSEREIQMIKTVESNTNALNAFLMYQKQSFRQKETFF